MENKAKTTLTVLGMCFVLGTAGTVYSADTYLVKDGKTEAKIFMPAKFGKATMFAAQELAGYIEKISGARPDISLGKPWPTQRIRIILECNPDGIADSFTLNESGGTVTIRGDSDVGVLYGVYQYLDNMGVRWFMPGELGENVPKMPAVKIGSYERKYASPFRSHGLSLSDEDPNHFDPTNLVQAHLDYDLWEMRNKSQFSHAIHLSSRHGFDFNYIREEGKHNIHTAALADADFKKEPERFPLVTRNGKKERLQKGGQICFTDPRNVACAVESARKFFAQNQDKYSYSLSLEDEGGVCECNRCVEANKGISPVLDPNRVVWQFMNAAAKKLQAECPGKSVCFLSPYGYMLHPPDGVRAETNIVCVACHTQDNGKVITDTNSAHNVFFLDCIRRIRKAGADMGSYEYTMFGGTPQPLTILDSVKTYRDLGFRFYSCESMGWDEQRRIVHWVMYQLCWDPDRDPHELLKTFCDDYYGAAGTNVLQTLYLINDSATNLPYIIIGGGGTAQSIMSDSVIARGRALLADAKGKVAGRELERLARYTDTFEMLSRRAEVARRMFLFAGERTEDNRATAIKALDEFLAFWKARNLDSICDPPTYRMLAGYRKGLSEAPLKVVPTASANLTNAPREAIVAEMFSFAKPPKNAGDATLLPELWKFKLDVYRVGVREGWMNPGFNDSNWMELSTYNFYESQGIGYDGEFWYRTAFKAPAVPKGKRLFMRIGALDDGGTIYVNGKEVLRRLCILPDDWQSSFEFDITDAVQPGEQNIAAVHGDDEYGMGGIHKPCGVYVK